MDIFHHHLQVRCLESLGIYLTEQLMLLMDISEDPSLNDSTFRRQYLVPFCTHLEKNILNTVRFYPSLAIVQNEAINMAATDISNFVTEVLLRHVISAMDTVKSNYGGENPKSKFHLERHTLCETVAAKIGVSIVHRLSTKFDFYRSHDYTDTSKIPKIFVEKFLEESYSKLKQLTFFRIRVNPIDKNIISTCLQDMQNLQEFCYREFCENCIIGTLATYCKLLKHLDIRDSKKVNDIAVPLIACFKELKTLEINGTEISPDGITKIMEDLRVIFPFKYHCCMKMMEIHGDLKGNKISYFGTSLNSRQVEDLSTMMPFLTSLHITISDNISLRPLSEFRNLTALGIGFDASSVAFPGLGFGKLHEILELLGRKLEKLSLWEVYGTDLQWLERKCRYLKYLSLEFNQCRDKITKPAILFGRDEVYPVPSCCDALTSFLNYEFLPHVKTWSVSGVLWRSDLFLLTLSELAKEGKIREISINNFDMKIIGTRVYVTSRVGVTFFVEVLKLYPILKNMFESGRRLDLRFELVNSL